VVGEEELRLEPFAEREVLERACVRHLRHTTFTDISGVGIYRRRGQRDRESLGEAGPLMSLTRKRVI
jgi:hypothetical protein